jgi:hypothetical protein
MRTRSEPADDDGLLAEAAGDCADTAAGAPTGELEDAEFPKAVGGGVGIEVLVFWSAVAGAML